MNIGEVLAQKKKKKKTRTDLSFTLQLWNSWVEEIETWRNLVNICRHTYNWWDL